MRHRTSDRPRWTSPAGRHRPVRVATAALALLLAAPTILWAQEGHSAYLLGPEDRVRLKVFEWRPSQDEIFEWKALNDEFTVNAAGFLSIPLAGEIPVQGLPLDAVARAVAERLRQRMNLTAPPDAAVDIVQYRPFYVAGDVTHPGPFPYHPGLTVLDAVAIAGGVVRPADLGLMRAGRDVITGEGDLDQLDQERAAQLVRRARLQAELRGDATFAAPAELDGSPKPQLVARVMAAETQILQARSKAYVTQGDALRDLEGFLDKETDSLTAQLATIDTQMELINKELVGITALVQKGVVVAPRQLALERSVAQIQGDRLSMETNKLRVQEEISKTRIALIQLHDTRVTDTSVELRDTQLKLDEILAKMRTGQKLVFEARVTAPGLLADRLRKDASSPTYVVVRQTGGQAAERVVSDSADVEPGDTVKVALPELTGGREPEGAAAASLASPDALQ